MRSPLACVPRVSERGPARRSFLVGLISLAVGLPVLMFLQTAFEIANDSEAPESWLEWPFTWRKLVFGFNAHRQWHYTGPKGQPNRHVRWFLRSAGAPPTETAINLVHSAVAAATCSEPPWAVEAREAAAEDGEGETLFKASDFPEWTMRAPASRSRSERFRQLAAGATCFTCGAAPPSDGHAVERQSSAAKAEHARLERDSGGPAPSSEGSSDEARELSRYKRIVAAAGLIGVYTCWAIFSWCVGAPCRSPRVGCFWLHC